MVNFGGTDKKSDMPGHNRKRHPSCPHFADTMVIKIEDSSNVELTFVLY